MKHPFISSSFLVESEKQVRIIQSLEIDHVLVDLDKSVRAASPAEPEETPTITVDEEAAELAAQKAERIAAGKDLRRKLQTTEKAFKQSMNSVQSLMQEIKRHPLQAINEANDLINDMADTIMQPDSLILHLVTSGAKEHESVYYHVMNVSVLAMMLGKELGMGEEEIKLLGMGAVFHDIGKINIPAKIIRSQEPLTGPEIDFLKQHPRLSVELLEKSETFPIRAMPIIKQHHEHLDGSGYPDGLSGDKIDPLAKLITIVNEFDNLCHPNDIKKAMSPHYAISYLFKNMKNKLSTHELSAFVKMLGVYPTGSAVLLNNGSIGIVMSSNPDNLLLPNVMTYNAEIPRLEAPIISLADENLSIESVLDRKSVV